MTIWDHFSSVLLDSWFECFGSLLAPFVFLAFRFARRAWRAVALGFALQVVTYWWLLTGTVEGDITCPCGALIVFVVLNGLGWTYYGLVLLWRWARWLAAPVVEVELESQAE